MIVYLRLGNMSKNILQWSSANWSQATNFMNYDNVVLKLVKFIKFKSELVNSYTCWDWKWLCFGMHDKALSFCLLILVNQHHCSTAYTLITHQVQHAHANIRKILISSFSGANQLAGRLLARINILNQKERGIKNKINRKLFCLLCGCLAVWFSQTKALKRFFLFMSVGFEGLF